MAVGSQRTSAVLTLRFTSVLAFLCSCRRCEMATLRSLTSAAYHSGEDTAENLATFLDPTGIISSPCVTSNRDETLASQVYKILRKHEPLL